MKNSAVYPILFKLTESDAFRFFIIAKCHLDAVLSPFVAILIELWKTDPNNPPSGSTYQLFRQLESNSFNNMSDALQQFIDPNEKLQKSTLEAHSNHLQQQGNEALDAGYHLIENSDLLYHVGLQLLSLQKFITKNYQSIKTPHLIQDRLEMIAYHMRSLLHFGLDITKKFSLYSGKRPIEAVKQSFEKQVAEQHRQTERQINPILSQLFNTFSKDRSDAQPLDPKCGMA